MKRITLSILLVMCTLLAYGRQYPLSTPKSRHDFGLIKEARGKVSCRFSLRNATQRPVVIVDVVTSCGCTKPTFDQRPIMPGKQTSIVVTFDPMNRPGAFDKRISVYGAGGVLLSQLSIVGRVEPRPKSLAEEYPFDLGGGVRANTSFCSFGYVYRGLLSQSVVGLVNTSKRAVELGADFDQRSGFLAVDLPRSLGAGARCEMRVGYMVPLSSDFYGSLEDVVVLRVGGKPSAYPIVVNGVAIEKPSDRGEKRAPKVQLNKNIVKFATVKHSSLPKVESFEIKNCGAGELIVRGVECKLFDCSLIVGMRIASGDSLRVDVRLDPAKCDYGLVVDRLKIITNDESQPMVQLRLTAIVED